MGRFFASASILFLFSGLAAGQSPDRRFELFGGYSFVVGDFSGTYVDRNTHVLNGWDASAAYKTSRLFGFVADVSGYYPHYTSPGLGAFTISARSLSFMFGPQVSVPLPRVTPFAHFLLGATHVGYPQPSGCPLCGSTSDNSFSYAAGGGIDIPLKHSLAFRGQADLFHTGFTTSDNQETFKFHHNDPRIAVGLVLRF